MRFLSLFAGIGGFDLGLERAGHVCAGQVEIEPFCRRVLERRFDAARWSDVREWSRDGVESPHLIVGGFPCQDLSIAGRRTGLAGERSGLFFEIVRIAKDLEPTWGIFENVPGLLSSHRGSDMWAVLTGLRECWPAVGYRILDSRYFGVAQRRRRVFFVCGPSIESVRAVLFEPEGGGWNSAESLGPWANLTARTGKGPDPDCTDGQLVTQALRHLGSGGADDNDAQAGFLTLSGPLGGGNDGIGRRTEDDPNLVAHALTGEGHDASEDGTGRGTPLHISNGVRRLTPLECERLQGFPDGWTCLCTPLEAYAADPDAAALACTCPDSPRYRALGNAVTVNVIEWLGAALTTTNDPR